MEGRFPPAPFSGVERALTEARRRGDDRGSIGGFIGGLRRSAGKDHPPGMKEPRTTGRVAMASGRSGIGGHRDLASVANAPSGGRETLSMGSDR